MVSIQLPHGKWQYNPEAPLGPRGGFGEVFAGSDENDNPVAIKRLHVNANQAAHREFRVADELVRQPLEYIMPVFDAGKDTESDNYYLVMPRAEKSLKQEIESRDRFTDREAIQILRQLAFGLREVRGLVHRDLKPGNVLYHERKWKLADFGIARFVEESTSVQTLKGFLSAQYAAPEQWLLQHTTQATDVYALGCIAYELLTGEPPFSGSSQEDYRHKHLHEQPPTLPDIHIPQLRSLISRMLRKEAQSRPDVERILNTFNEIEAGNVLGYAGRGFDELANAGANASQLEAQEEANRSLVNSKRQAREKLAQSGKQIIDEVLDTFAKLVASAASAAQINGKGYQFKITLGDAILEVQPLNGGQTIEENAFSSSNWDTILGIAISVIQKKRKAYIWSANLWYTNLGLEDYRWWEVPYMTHALARSKAQYQPFAVTDISQADKAAGPVMDIVAMAAKPRPIDDENTSDFCERWAGLLAKAFKGELEHPSYLPLD